MSSDPGGHAGSSPEYDVVVRCDVGVAMDDGATLFADIYVPALNGEPLSGAWPVLLERSPYDKGREAHSTTGRFFAQRGYVYVVQDVRGRYSSDGEFRFLRNEADDGEATMRWLAAQPWCGSIGTLGISYTTATQQALAVRHPAKLATQALFDGPYNYFRQTMRHGGACEYGIAFQYVVFMAQASKQAAADPVVQAGLDEMWASLTDWLGHQAIAKGETPLSLTPDYEQWFFDMLTTSDYTDYWITPGLEHRGVHRRLSRHSAAVGDVVVRPPHHGHAVEVRAVEAASPHAEEADHRHLAARRRHVHPVLRRQRGVRPRCRAGRQQQPPAPLVRPAPEGASHRARPEAPVRLFVMGGGSGRRDAAGRLIARRRWRDEQEWPLARAVDTTFFLPSGRCAGAKPPTDTAAASRRRPIGSTRPIRCRPWAATSPTTAPRGSWKVADYDQLSGTMSGDNSPSAPLEDRHDVIVFRTPPLSEGVEVTGVVTCHLWVSSSAVDTDFTVKLIDEYPPNADYPNGYALNLGDSILRMRYRDGFDGPSFMNPGEIYEIELRLQATSNFFAPGHRIRVDVSSSNFPHYDVNPNTGEHLGLNEGVVTATQAIYHDSVRPSHVVLPVVPVDTSSEPAWDEQRDPNGSAANPFGS